MTIINTVKKIIPYIKEATGYVLCRISSQGVEMDDGSVLEDKITEIVNSVDETNILLENTPYTTAVEESIYELPVHTINDNEISETSTWSSNKMNSIIYHSYQSVEGEINGEKVIFSLENALKTQGKYLVVITCSAYISTTSAEEDIVFGITPKLYTYEGSDTELTNLQQTLYGNTFMPVGIVHAGASTMYRHDMFLISKDTSEDKYETTSIVYELDVNDNGIELTHYIPTPKLEIITLYEP